MKNLILCPLLLFATACSSGWTESERDIVNSQSEILPVYTVDNSAQEAILRTVCTDLTEDMLKSQEYVTLADKMVNTVTSPEQDGVGIAGPQVGIPRRIVAVMRYDKPGTPFEVYPNIRITTFHGDKVPGPEGCLSVPDKSGDVLRYRDIEISYTNPVSLKDTTERIQGFTAVIFQHECDHLNGIIYTDKLIN